MILYDLVFWNQTQTLVTSVCCVPTKNIAQVSSTLADCVLDM